MDGVIAFYSAKDVPGDNACVNVDTAFMAEREELFVTGPVKFHGQPLGVIVANTLDLAHRAAGMVHVTYDKQSVRRPVLVDMRAVFEAKDTSRITSELVFAGAEEDDDDFGADLKVEGHLAIGGQYHYTLEPQTTVCRVVEDGFELHSACQWIDLIHTRVAKALNVPANKITIQVRRLGGGYGSKIKNSSMVACACALVCFHLRRTARFVMTIEQNMTVAGKRNSFENTFKAKVDANGAIKSLAAEYFSDYGCSNNEFVTYYIDSVFKSVYKADKWKLKSNVVITDAPSSSWTRAPGHVESVAMAENIMEHIAFATKKNAINVRLANMADSSALKTTFKTFLKDIEYKERRLQLNEYNAANRWKKKGIAAVPINYVLGYFGKFTALVSVYHTDGTVTIVHGGIEMGQGINTKACQVAAHVLGISLEMVSVQPSVTHISPNGYPTGGSQTSEAVAFVSE